MTDDEGPPPDDAFAAFMHGALPGLLRFGHVLTGDPLRAEELTQAALVKTWLHWRRVDEPYAYVRRAMVNTHTSWWRRTRREAALPEPGLAGAAHPAPPPRGRRRRTHGPEGPAAMTDLETLLAHALEDARTDPAWAVRPRALTVDGVRRSGRTRRRGTRALAATSSAAVLVAGALVYVALPGPDQATLRPAAVGPGRAVPGIRPAFVPTSGRDWLLSQAGYDAFTGVHVLPSPGPGQSTVASPAPLEPASAALQADAAAGLPAGARVRREDSPGGEPGVQALHVTLPDGTPVEVERRLLQTPRPVQELSCGCDDPAVPDPAVRDVPGSSSVYVAVTNAPYGMPDRQDRTSAVTVMTAGGVQTSWWAPETVPLATIQSWALAAETHAVATG